MDRDAGFVPIGIVHRIMAGVSTRARPRSAYCTTYHIGSAFEAFFRFDFSDQRFRSPKRAAGNINYGCGPEICRASLLPHKFARASPAAAGRCGAFVAPEIMAN